jgi:hypothetical protein
MREELVEIMGFFACGKPESMPKFTLSISNIFSILRAEIGIVARVEAGKPETASS